MRNSLMATASALALLLGTAALVGTAPVAAEEPTDTEQPLNGEDLVEDPTHGMGEGDDAIGGGVSTHGLEGERGYADLDEDERQDVRIEDEENGWTLDDLLGASIVDGNGETIGSIEDLIVDEDDQIRKVVLPLDGETGTFYLIPIEELRRATGDGGDLLVFAGDREGGDFERVVRQDERWLPQAD